jgi:Rhs family protein
MPDMKASHRPLLAKIPSFRRSSFSFQANFELEKETNMSDKNTPAQTSAPNITNQDTSQPKTSRAKPKPATHPGATPIQDRIPSRAPTPAEAREIMESRAASYTPREVLPAIAGDAKKTFIAPSQITELARALNNDLDLIFYHVYNNIDFSYGYGLQKGSVGALLDGTANPWDQAQLLVDLLREAGYTADFVFGTIDLSNEQVSSWLGTDNSNISNAYSVLVTAGVPVQAVWSGTEWRLELSHIWVKVTVDTDEFMFDPSFKTYSTTTGIDLEDALGYDRASLLSIAEDGATKDVNGEWIENVNTAGIKSELATYATNLISWIETNNPTATIDDIVGGRKITEIASPVRQTSLPYQKVGDTPTVWTTTIPDVYRLKVTFTNNARGINFFRYSDELYGKRLTLFYNSSIQPVYRLDGEVLATGTSTSLGNADGVLIQWIHPYATTQHNGSQFVGTWAGNASIPNSQLKSFWLIGLSFGQPGKGTIDLHYQRSVARKAAGAPEDDEELVGSQLATVWYTNVAGQASFDEILGRMTNCRSIVHHVAAVLHSETVSDHLILNYSSPRISVISLDGTTANAIKFSHGISIAAQKQEAVSVQQVWGQRDATNSSRVLEVANANGTRIYRADSNNWNNIKGSLNYPAWVNPDAYIGSLVGSGWVFTIPQEGNNIPGIAGGFEGNHPNGGAAGPIYYGQITAKGIDCGPWEFNPDGNKGKGDCGGGSGSSPQNKSPSGGGGGFPQVGRMPAVGVFAGECGFHYSAPSFTTGSSAYPYSLSFEAEYSSCRREVSSSLGRGWSHNWIQNAREKNDPFRGLGYNSPVEAAASLAAFHSYMDLTLDTTLPITNLMTLWMVANWWGDEMTNTVVRVELEDEIREYAKLANGSYYRPADASTLVKSGDQFILTSPEQIVHTFNSDGNLETIEYPFGVTVSLTYADGKVTKVDNGMGRSFTFSYSGDQLVAVKDDSVVSPLPERQIQFAFSSEQLVAITDPLGEDITYEYDEPGRMVSYFLPQNPTSPLITNSYSTDDKLVSQLDANSNQTTFYKSPTRHEFVNPLGHSLVYFFDSGERLAREIDELGFETKYRYDPLGRLVEMEYPDGQKTLWTYTSKHKVATVTNKAKPGSGLADIVSSATYEATFNKIATATDGRGNTTSYTYASNGQVETVVSPVVNGGSPTVTMTYNVRGQPVTITEPTGIVTKFEYAFDTDPQATEVVTKMTFDFGTGRKNLVTEYGYNAWGNMTSAKDPRGNSSTATFDYKRRPTERRSAAPFNFASKFTFDKNDNLVRIERQTGNPSAPWQMSEVTHDIDGKLLTTRDPLNIVTTRQYDELNRLWKFTDGENRTTEHVYNERSQVETLIEPGNHIVETNTYGPSGELLSVEDEKSIVVQFTRDGFNRPSKVIYPDGTFEQIESYDGNGNALITVTRAGEPISFTFDALNRVLTKAAAGKPVVNFPTTFQVASKPSRRRYKAETLIQACSNTSTILLGELLERNSPTARRFPTSWTPTEMSFDSLIQTPILSNVSSISSTGSPTLS